MTVELYHPTLEAGSVDSIVTDPPAGISFMGSGSILVAAILEGRDVIGIELERESFEVAQARIEVAQQEMVQARFPV